MIATRPDTEGVVDAARITKRFNAVVDLYDSRQLDSLEEPDLELMRRATRYRESFVAARD